MARLVEMDERLSIFAQMDKEDEVKSPVILINKFNVATNEIDQFLKGWSAEAGKFKQQPGYIYTQLHRGIGESGTFINYAVWESVAHFKKAVTNVIDPQDPVSAFPPSTMVSPHLFKKVAVSGLCIE
jgi:quinol monooxygenase YgiN